MGIPSLTLTPQAVKTFHFTWTDVAGEAEYRLLESADGVAPLTAVATVAANMTSYDLTVPLFRRLGAQYVLRACNGATCSDSLPVTVAGSLAAAIGYFKPSNAGMGDKFGGSLALSADGTTLAVGASSEASGATGIGGNQNDNSAPASGAVYVFFRSGTGWVQQAYVKASNTEGGDDFGVSVSLSADGNTLAVGARNEASSATGVGGNETDNSMAASGAVYVFSRNGSAWSQQAYLKASNTGAGDEFGAQLTLSGDGATLAVSALKEDSNATGVGGNQSDNSAQNAGAVYVFSKNGVAWSQQAYIKASNSGAGDGFGRVALSSNGDTLAVGASGEASNATGIGGNQSDNSAAGSGAVYVFSRSGTAWSQEAYVKASNTGPGDAFGISVSLSADGNTLAAGAPLEDSNATGIGGSQSDESAVTSGAVYLFLRNGPSWSQQAYVKASNTGAGDAFGFSVALSADGVVLAVGALFEASSGSGLGGAQGDNSAPQSGAVYVFSRSVMVWSFRTYVKASNTGAMDTFGSSCALSGDGSTLAVGATNEASNSNGIGSNQNDNTASESGAVYLY